jgi:hypothetical protein
MAKIDDISLLPPACRHIDKLLYSVTLNCCTHILPTILGTLPFVYQCECLRCDAAWDDGARRDGDQVQGQDEGAAAEGGALQLEEDGQDRHQVSKETRHQRR